MFLLEEPNANVVSVINCKTVKSKRLSTKAQMIWK